MCEYKYVEVKYIGSLLDLNDVFDTWISEDKFDPDDLFEFKYVAVGCTWVERSNKCGFLFADEFIGIDSTKSIPDYIPTYYSYDYQFKLAEFY